MGVPSGGSTPDIRLVELTKRFGEVVAVDAISLDIRAGEFFSLLGPSGCGKTTTLRMIGGFELPTSGRVELRGRDVTREPPERRPVNMVFERFGGRDEVRRRNPFSFLLCPLSPLVLEGPYTDAWLATADWGIPVAAMPMRMMGLRLGVRDVWDHWEASGRPDIVDEARRTVADALAAHRPLPMDEATARELAVLVDRAAAAGARATTGFHATKGR